MTQVRIRPGHSVPMHGLLRVGCCVGHEPQRVCGAVASFKFLQRYGAMLQQNLGFDMSLPDGALPVSAMAALSNSWCFTDPDGKLVLQAVVHSKEQFDTFLHNMQLHHKVNYSKQGKWQLQEQDGEQHIKVEYQCSYGGRPQWEVRTKRKEVASGDRTRNRPSMKLECESKVLVYIPTCMAAIHGYDDGPAAGG